MQCLEAWHSFHNQIPVDLVKAGRSVLLLLPGLLSCNTLYRLLGLVKAGSSVLLLVQGLQSCNILYRLRR